METLLHFSDIPCNHLLKLDTTEQMAAPTVSYIETVSNKNSQIWITKKNISKNIIKIIHDNDQIKKNMSRVNVGKFKIFF